MKFATILLALAATVVAQNDQHSSCNPGGNPGGNTGGPKCSVKTYTKSADEDVKNNCIQAWTYFCASPGGFDHDTDPITGVHGWSIMAPVSNTLSLKVFAENSPNNVYSHCVEALVAIQDTCILQMHQYGSYNFGGEYYSITMHRGNMNDNWNQTEA